MHPWEQIEAFFLVKLSFFWLKGSPQGWLTLRNRRLAYQSLEQAGCVVVLKSLAPLVAVKWCELGNAHVVFFWDCVLFLIYTKKMGHSHVCIRCVSDAFGRANLEVQPHHFLLGSATISFSPQNLGEIIQFDKFVCILFVLFCQMGKENHQLTISRKYLYQATSLKTPPKCNF